MIDISVIIPTHNRIKYLPRAIDSCLEQENVDIEIIIINDGSTDDTQSYLENLGIENLVVINKEKNIGAPGARNTGINVANGNYLKFLDSDDYLIKNTLSVEYTKAESTVSDIVISDWYIEYEITQDENNKLIKRKAPVINNNIDDILKGYAVATGAALYKRKYIVDNNIMWDAKITKLMDWDLFVTAALYLGKITTIENLSYVFFNHKDERITSTTMLNNALNHHYILGKIEQRLTELNELTDKRKKRLAQYYFKELQVLSVYDYTSFEKSLKHIFYLDKKFVPRDEVRSRLIKVSSPIIGVKATLLLYRLYKKILLMFVS